MRVGIGLGSNVGERLRNLQRARDLVLALPGILPATASGARPGDCLLAPVFESEPVGCPPGSAPFLNTVMEVGFRPRCSPLHLLDALRQLERTLGRPSRYPRNSPRCIDLDILYADQLVMATSQLSLPHPRMHTRRFVLAPLAVIRPELVLPGHQQPVESLLRDVDDPSNVQAVHPQW